MGITKNMETNSNNIHNNSTIELINDVTNKTERRKIIEKLQLLTTNYINAVSNIPTIHTGFILCLCTDSVWKEGDFVFQGTMKGKRE